MKAHLGVRVHMPMPLRQRAEYINLRQVSLARIAGIDKHTVGRVLAGDRNVLKSSQDAVRLALEAEERRVLAHLMALHGVAEPRGRAFDEAAALPAAAH